MNQGNRANDKAIAWYEAHAASVAEGYEALSFPEVHDWRLYRLPERRDTTVLDIGAGSGTSPPPASRNYNRGIDGNYCATATGMSWKEELWRMLWEKLRSRPDPAR